MTATTGVGVPLPPALTSRVRAIGNGGRSGRSVYCPTVTEGLIQQFVEAETADEIQSDVMGIALPLD